MDDKSKNSKKQEINVEMEKAFHPTEIKGIS
jgi:hypothetical protein